MFHLRKFQWLLLLVMVCMMIGSVRAYLEFQRANEDYVTKKSTSIEWDIKKIYLAALQELYQKSVEYIDTVTDRAELAGRMKQVSADEIVSAYWPAQTITIYHLPEQKKALILFPEEMRTVLKDVGELLSYSKTQKLLKSGLTQSQNLSLYLVAGSYAKEGSMADAVEKVTMRKKWKILAGMRDKSMSAKLNELQAERHAKSVELEKELAEIEEHSRAGKDVSREIEAVKIKVELHLQRMKQDETELKNLTKYFDAAQTEGAVLELIKEDLGDKGNLVLVQNESYKTWALIFLGLSILGMFCVVVLGFYFNVKRFGTQVVLICWDLGVHDSTFEQLLIAKYRKEWVKSREPASVLALVRRECWLYRLKLDRAIRERNQKVVQNSVPTQAVVQKPKKLDKRQLRAQEKSKEKKQKETPVLLIDTYAIPDAVVGVSQDSEAKEISSEQLDTLTIRVQEILSKAGMALYRLEDLSEARLVEFKNVLSAVKEHLARRLWRQWLRWFDGSDESTYLPAIELFRKKDFEGIRAWILKEEESCHPRRTKSQVSLVEGLKGKRLLVVGGNPSLAAFYQDALVVAGVKSVRWYPGSTNIDKMRKQKCDVVVLLLRYLQHDMSNRVRAQIAQARIVVSPWASRSRFLPGIIEKLG